MKDTSLHVWTIVAMATVVLHMFVTLAQACDILWAQRQPNRRFPRYFRRAWWRIAITMSFLIIAAAALAVIHITQ